jgi:hypothetical protein
MAASYNPYEAPGASGYSAAQNASGGGMITPLMVDHLRNARPWIRFLSVMCFVGAGFMILAAGLMFLGGMVGLAASKSRTPGSEALVGPIGGVFYFLMSGVYVLPGVLMHRIANAIDGFVTMPSSSSLEDALDKNRSYWKVCGIMALITIAFMMLTIVGAIVVGVIAGLSARP